MYTPKTCWYCWWQQLRNTRAGCTVYTDIHEIQQLVSTIPAPKFGTQGRWIKGQTQLQSYWHCNNCRQDVNQILMRQHASSRNNRSNSPSHDKSASYRRLYKIWSSQGGIKITILCHLTPCGLIDRYLHFFLFGGACCLRLQGIRNEGISQTLKMESAVSSKTSVPTHRTTWHHQASWHSGDVLECRLGFS
jgi:hypothetical protein